MGRFTSVQLAMGFVVLYLFFLFLFLGSLSPENRNLIFPAGNGDPPFGNPKRFLSDLVFTGRQVSNASLYKSAIEAWHAGSKIMAKLTRRGRRRARTQLSDRFENKTTSCPHAISFTGAEFRRRGMAMALPCGLSLGSHVTVVGKPRAAHVELYPAISGGRMTDVMVSQFMLELRKVDVVANGEEPSRILHFNPRIKGDWSGRPVIEMNACYRGQWGTAIRCDGWQTPPAEISVDGHPNCDSWIRDDDELLDGSKSSWWYKYAESQKLKNEVKWPYPFVENKHFVLTVNSGLEGYHISVDGRHIASFPYRTGYDLDDATGLYLHGDIDVHSLYAASLPTLHPSVSRHKYLEMSPQWKSPYIPGQPVELFIGIISAGDHFAERMAIRKSWMQHYLFKSSKVLARFFIALVDLQKVGISQGLSSASFELGVLTDTTSLSLKTWHEREAVNVELLREAEFFGDIVLLPYLDNYDLVVLKTVAICEHGVNTFTASYIMKCDDDTFVSIDPVMMIVERFGPQGSIYIGKMNYYHKPLREGKWAVTFEEWAEEYYPTYADGAGYVVSSDIARFIVSEFKKNKLRLFKMEDVSVGMWVEQFNATRRVEYLHSSRFVQSGCVDEYFTAHYQSPKQMICLWKKLQDEGKPSCCNWR